MVEQDNIDAKTVAMMGICGAITIFVVIVLLQVLFYRQSRADFVAKFVKPGWQELKTVQTEQRQALQGYAWTDREAGIAHVPIARAMEVTLERLQAVPAPVPVAVPVPPVSAKKAR